MIAYRHAPPGVAYRCCAIDCVNPKHIKVSKDRAGMIADVVRVGKFSTEKGSVSRNQNLKAARRVRGIVDTPVHHVIAIRASKEPLRVLACMYGVSESCVSQIRLGQARKDVKEAA